MAPEPGDLTMLRLAVTDGRADVTLARPEARNALNEPMCEELRAVFAALDGDDEVRCVVIGGEGSVFCAGADLKERKGRDEAWVRQRRLKAFAAYDAVAACRKPVVAVIDGPVVGSGGEIAMSADFIVASDKASFRFPEPQWGTVGATQRLQRVIGKRRAKELLFTGRIMDADEAYRVGLIARLVASDGLAATVDAIVRDICAAPPAALALTKRAVDRGEETTLSDGIGIEIEAIDEILAGSEWKGGLARFEAQFGERSEG